MGINFEYLGRDIEVRADVLGCPVQVIDVMILRPHNLQLERTSIIKDVSRMTPLPLVGTYRFPHARSPRGQIRWKRASAPVEYPQHYYPTVG